MEELFADPEIDMVLNLTRPYQHFEVSKAALLAGKHVYSEKPLATTLEDGIEICKFASEKGLLVGGAPDTFMGAGIQTCRKLIDEGLVGDIIGGIIAIGGLGFAARDIYKATKVLPAELRKALEETTDACEKECLREVLDLGQKMSSAYSSLAAK